MKKFILLFYFLFLVPAHAQYVIAEGSHIPLELQLLVKSLVELKLPPEDINTVVELSKEINRNLKFLTKDQAYFLIKSQIYKAVLEKEFQGDFKIMKFSSMEIEAIEKNYEANKQKYSLFSRWLVESVLADFRELKNYPGFNQVRLDVVDKDPTLNLIRRKTNLLSPWLGAISSLEAKEFNARMKKIMMSMLRDISLGSQVYRKSFATKVVSEEDFFKFKGNSLKSIAKPKPQEEASDLQSEAKIAEESALKAVENINPVPPKNTQTPAPTKTWGPLDLPANEEKSEKIPEAPIWQPEEE